MPHAHSRSDDVASTLPPSLRVYIDDSSASRSSPCSAPEPSLHRLFALSPASSSVPLSASTPFYHPSPAYSPLEPSSASAAEEGGPEAYTGLDSGTSSDINFDFHARDLAGTNHDQSAPPSWDPTRYERSEHFGDGQGQGEQGVNATGETDAAWYANTFGDLVMSDQDDIVRHDYEHANVAQEHGRGGGGGTRGSLNDHEQGEQFCFSFDLRSPSPSSSGFAQSDLSPVENLTDSPSYAWFAPPPSTSVCDHTHLGATYETRLRLESASLFPSFDFTSPPIATAPLATASSIPPVYSALEFNHFNPTPSTPNVDSSPQYGECVSNPVQDATIDGSHPTFHRRLQQENADAPERSRGRHEGGSEIARFTQRALVQESRFSPPGPPFQGQRFSYPSPVHLAPLSSPRLSDLPTPSPNFRLDQPTSPLPPCSQLPPPSQSSCIDLPPLPASSATSVALLAPLSSPDSSPPAAVKSASTPRVPSTATKKHRSSSSSSSASSSSAIRPRRESSSSSSNVVGESGARISKITGRPTKVISKRTWPPKDADKRRYNCEVEGCGKTFGRPSALNTHMRTHDGAKPFNCPVPTCARPFSVFSNLKRHMALHPSVDFRFVTVNDLASIHWVADEHDPGGDGGRLEWVDELRGDGSDQARGGQDQE